MLAMFRPSWNAPLFTAPSPKNATATRWVLSNLSFVAGPGRLEDARSDNPTRAEHADLWRKQVHAAAAAPRAARLATVELREERAWLEPLRERVPVPAMGAEDGVLRGQMSAHGRGDGLLADIGVAGAMDEAALMRFREPLLDHANDEHGAEEGER